MFLMTVALGRPVKNNPSTVGLASVVVQMVKQLPAMRETWVRSLGWEDPLEKEMATHSSILAWKIPWMEEPGRLQSMGSQSRIRLSNFTHSLNISEFQDLIGTCVPYVLVCGINVDLGNIFESPLEFQSESHLPSEPLFSDKVLQILFCGIFYRDIKEISK